MAAETRCSIDHPVCRERPQEDGSPVGLTSDDPAVTLRREKDKGESYSMSPTASPDAKIPTLAIDPFATDFLRDPYPRFHALREAGPVVWLPAHGVHAVARYAEAKAVLADHQTFISGAGVGLKDLRREPGHVLARGLTLQIDPPEHTRGRVVLGRTMSLPVAKRLREDFAAEAEALVGRLVTRRRIDAIPDLAEAYPLKVFPDAVGIGEAGREHLLAWSTLVFNAFGPENSLVAASRGPGQRALEWVMANCRREAVAPGGLAAMIYAAVDRGELTEEEAPFLVRPFLTAGIDTTVSGLGNMLLGFATHPEQWARLRADPKLARPAFEEALRWESPVQAFFRTAARDTEIAGQPIPADAKVLVFMASANRDPRQWHDPEAFDITRDTRGHLAFGTGIHLCVGQMIARLEAELILEALLRRVAEIRPAGAPRRKLNNTMRALESLPLELVPA